MSNFRYIPSTRKVQSRPNQKSGNLTASLIGALQIRNLITFLYLIIGLLGSLSLAPFGVLAGLMMFLAITDLLVTLDDDPVMLELTGAIAVLQQLFGPWVLYEFFNTHPLYRMWVPQAIYFPFAFGGTVMFLVALRTRFAFGSARFRLGLLETDSFKRGIVLVAIGLLAGVLVRYGPGSLKFFFYLIANLRYVGAIYVYTSGNKYRMVVVTAVICGIYFTATSVGMFHELILWACLGGSYWFVGKKRGMTIKVLAICVGVASIVVIQAVKPFFRKQLLIDENASFASAVMDLEVEDVFSRKSAEDLTIRISQGWLVSAAMYTTPTHVPFGHGITFYEAAEAALVPRFINPNKRIASPRDNLHKFTFIRVNETTQMGIGSLGEAWVNFGMIGGILTMGVYGLILNGVFRYFVKLSWKNSFFFFCLPIVFLQAVKVETESLTVFNHLVKSGVVIFVAYAGLRSAGLLQK